jgi:hypothetical protein
VKPLRGFHASLGRGDPCTQYSEREDAGLRPSFTSPVILRGGGRRAQPPVGEGSGLKLKACNVGAFLSRLPCIIFGS